MSIKSALEKAYGRRQRIGNKIYLELDPKICCPAGGARLLQGMALNWEKQWGVDGAIRMSGGKVAANEVSLGRLWCSFAKRQAMQSFWPRSRRGCLL
jgi:hypothetical protein